MRIVNQILLTFFLNACWQIAIIIAFVALSTHLLRQSSARVRHGLWVAGLLLCVSVPLFTTITFFVEPPVLGLPTTVRPNTVFTQPQLSDAWLLNHPEMREASSSFVLTPVLGLGSLAVFLVILLYQSLRLGRAWHATQRIRKTTFKTEIDTRVGAVLDHCEQSIPGWIGRVEILCSDTILVPITMGLFRPKIVLPGALVRGASDEILLSAIGHEFVHVIRRDYLFNLIYEILYLPISFHPAAALARRRVKQTRELCCDELVAERILRPEAYARSLVTLAGSIPNPGRLSPITTVGIADADILETRIMSLLKKSDQSHRWKRMLLFVSLLLLAVPCVTAASFAMKFDVSQTSGEIVKYNVQESKERAEKEETERRARRPLDEQEMKLRMENDPQFRAEVMKKRQIEMEMRAVKQAALIRLARINMDQAIQIANSQYPGKVLQCSLEGEKWEEPGKLAKDGFVFYHVVLVGEDADAGATHVWVNAVDGSIIKTEKELIRKMRSAEP
jgi:beta-lactamase regulating signal transducer with metallopeptidase domain/uncharacterized membrane protein YkoI